MKHRDRLGAFACVLSLCIASAPAVDFARAEDLEKAKKTVNAATKEQLLAEFQRRWHAEKGGLKGVTRSIAGRGEESPLSAIDDQTLVAAVRTRTIYGHDDREEWFQIHDESVSALARASVALFDASGAIRESKGVSLKTVSLQKAQGLCATERYAAQPAGAFCSGTLVRPDVVLTAGHCVREIDDSRSPPPLPDVRFVFGYRLETAQSNPVSIPAEQVFAGREVLGGERGETRDWALVRLDRPVPAAIAKPISEWDPMPVKIGQKVFVIGYPSGIPLKYAPGASVQDTSNPGYFKADLDTFGGNSGSGVFDQATKKLIGVLVRGDTDYVKDPSGKCMQAKVCPRYADCRGEDVTRISAVTNFP